MPWIPFGALPFHTRTAFGGSPIHSIFQSIDLLRRTPGPLPTTKRQTPAQSNPAAGPAVLPLTQQEAPTVPMPTPAPVAAKSTPASISGPVMAKGSKRYGSTKQRQGKPTATPAPKPTSTAAPKRGPPAHKTGKRSGGATKPKHHATPTPAPASTPEECKTSEGVPQGQPAHTCVADEAKAPAIKKLVPSTSRPGSPSSSLGASSSDVLSSSSTILSSSPHPSSPSSAAPLFPTTSEVVEHIDGNEGGADDGDKTEAQVEATPQTSVAPAQPTAIASAAPVPSALHHQPEQQQQEPQESQQVLHSPPAPSPSPVQQASYSLPPPAPAAHEAVLYEHIGEPVYVEKTDRGVYYRYKSDLDRSGSSNRSGYSSHHSSGHGSYGGHGSHHGSQVFFAPDAASSYFPQQPHYQHSGYGYNNTGHHSSAASIDLSGSGSGYPSGYYPPNASMPPPPPPQVYHQQKHQGYTTIHPQQQQQQHIQQPVAWMRWQRINQPYPSSHYHHPNAPWQEVAFYRPGYYEGPMIFPTRHFHAPMSPLRTPARYGGKHRSHHIPSSSGRRPSMGGYWQGSAQYGASAQQGGYGYMGGY